MSVLEHSVPILDHGYVKFIESWGTDERIIEAARMSTDKGFLGWEPGPCGKCGGSGQLIIDTKVWHDPPERKRVSPRRVVLLGGHFHYQPKLGSCGDCNGKGTLAGDQKLLAYLSANRHDTPFEMAGMVIELQSPIMVFREWHRHRTQSYNEMSARYTPLPDVNYMPTVDRCLMVSAANKQAGAIKGADELTHESVLEWLEELAGVYEVAERVYQSGLSRGIPKEIARLPVPVGRYSRMRASANLRNWLGFLTLRMAPNAQWEIRQFANAVGNLIASLYPRTWELFINRGTK